MLPDAYPITCYRGQFDPNIKDYSGSEERVDIISTGHGDDFSLYSALKTAGIIPINTDPRVDNTYWGRIKILNENVATKILIKK